MDSFVVSLILGFCAVWLGYAWRGARARKDAHGQRLENAKLRDQLAEAKTQLAEFDIAWNELKAERDALEVKLAECRKATRKASKSKPRAVEPGEGRSSVPEALSRNQRKADEEKSKTYFSQIVTRTTPTSPGVTAEDNWHEKTDWLESEETQLKSMLNAGRTIAQIAVAMKLDQKDIAYRATRLYFDEWGELDDIPNAPNNQTTWSINDTEKLFSMHKSGGSLDSMASSLGRTKIAIGWKLSNSKQLSFY
jgi:hypothetical protein